MLSIDVTISTYNRVQMVDAAIGSALKAVRLWGNGSKVIIVDDKSKDNTINHLKTCYANEMQAGLLLVIEHKENLGVTGAKNTGFKHSNADWVIFLDSDDELFLASLTQIQSFLDNHMTTPIVFFRCKDQNGRKVGQCFSETQVLHLKRYVKYTSYGEALTAVNKRIVREPPYIQSLRGYEGLGCSRIIKKYGPGLLAPIYARKYVCEGSERLSAKSVMLRRSGLLLRGHICYFKEFYKEMTFAGRLKFMFKIIAYACFATINFLTSIGQ